jgi:hypothetical protein
MALFPITPLKLCGLWPIVAAVWVVRINNDPSIDGWAYTFATAFFIFAGVLFGLDYWLYSFLKESRYLFWVIQVVLSLACLLFYAWLGLPTKF